MEPLENYDLLLVADATSSMSSYLTSLQTSLPKIISISSLTQCFSRIGLLAYRDYCDGENLIEWSGWLEAGSDSGMHQKDAYRQRTDEAEDLPSGNSKLGPRIEDGNKANGPDLIKQAKSLRPIGGGDFPEATKTGLAKAYSVMRPGATTIVLLYTDAPPHLEINGGSPHTSHFNREKKALSDPTNYGGEGAAFIDWVSACKVFHEGPKKAQVFSILSPSMQPEYAGHYNYLSAITRGAVFNLENSTPLSISQVTVEVLLSWMGVEKTGSSSNIDTLPAKMSRYIDIKNIKDVSHESDPKGGKFFATTSNGMKAGQQIRNNLASKQLTHDILTQYLPKKKNPVQDFAKRYASDGTYRKTVVEQLGRIIEEDVSAISLNPIFGSLWRAVCNDRKNEARDSLITSFGLHVDRISNEDEKARMKAWLEESYDFTAEVLEMIDAVPIDQRYPCVLLDPTLAFSRDTGKEEVEGEEVRGITSFRRDELLEIGRSCDYKILRRLGRVLTQLTYVSSPADLPAHIASTTDQEVPKIPMALASKEQGRSFWTLLLHLVVPGTKLGARPAALLAALAIRMAVQPLLEIAQTEMLFWRKRWNDIEVPETWNVGCMSLLLEADQAYRKRIGDDAGLLLRADRELFDRLVSYKMLELNMDTTLTARVGWTPEKTPMPIGPVVICRACQYPRSVTIMGRKGICGICAWTDWKNDQERSDWIDHRVSKADSEATTATWVECNVRTCRAQYVVYYTEALNVRPKCHFCRLQGGIPAETRNASPAPCLECTVCLNRVIWPEEYRPEGLSESEFKCTACSNGRKTVVDVETTAKAISAENTTAWLIRNEDGKIKELFNGRSLYHTISTATVEDFCDRVTLFPSIPGLTLTLRSKRIRNVLEPGDQDGNTIAGLSLSSTGLTKSIISELKSWVSRRRTEGATCDLCFSSTRKTDVHPACGRRGCHQRICGNCLRGWYGLNSAGRLINTAALHCPFCRRAPTAKTLAGYGMGIHAVGNLAQAVGEAGSWIYAWCQTCGVAKQYMERVCAQGAPPDLNGWVCDECRESKEKGGRSVNRTCPGCGVMTEKTGGCDHIQCPCGEHWCYYCGKAFSGEAIYDHMATDHGGYYGGEDVYDYESEDEDQ